MAKDPAFNFYTNDFDAKTKFFSHEQVGMYIRLLMAQHQHGHLTKQQMMYICGRYDEDVFLKFSVDQDGKFYNERLELEVNKRRAYSESRKNNRKSTKQNTSSSYDTTHVKTMSTHMENEYEIEKENELNNKKGVGNFEETWKQAFDELTIESYKMKYRLLDITDELDQFRLKCSADPQSYHTRDPAGLRMAFLYQLRNTGAPKKILKPKLHELS